MKRLNNKKIDLLIIIPPSAGRNPIWPPYGAMYIASYFRQQGYNPAILNIDVERISNADIIERVKSIAPRYLGFSGMVATSYKYIKKLSNQLKQSFPETVQILGGGLTCAANTVLGNSSIDIVVKGEGEITICELINCLERGGNLKEVLGIYYREKDSLVFTDDRPLIRNLDTLPYPAFDLVDMEHYIFDGPTFIRNFNNKIKDKRIYEKDRSRRMVNIIINRGCIGCCSFCVRPDLGIRMHSIKYVFDYIEYCVQKFNVGFLSFGDECFAPTKKRNWEFIEEYKKRKLNLVFRLLGLRVDAIDKDILKAFKEIGCWKINYGFESGSQKMLNIIDKMVTVEQNINAATWTKEAGLYTPPQIILGMPGENDKTIGETLNFMKSLDLDFKQFKWTIALPIPGSQLYDFAKLSGAITNEDQYLTSLGESGTGFLHVNLTDYPDEVVENWGNMMTHELDYWFFQKKYKIMNKLIFKILYFFYGLEYIIRRRELLDTIIRKITALFKRKASDESVLKNKIIAPYRKKEEIIFEELIRECDYTKINRSMSLKNINMKLKQAAEMQ